MFCVGVRETLHAGLLNVQRCVRNPRQYWLSGRSFTIEDRLCEVHCLQFTISALGTVRHRAV